MSARKIDGSTKSSALFDEGSFIDGQPVSAAEFAAHIAANNHLRLYDRLRNGILIWRAYSEYRRRGVAVPEKILSKLDAYAAELECAVGPPAVAKALELSSDSGGASGPAAVRKVAAQREIASLVYFHLYQREPRVQPAEAFALVAKRYGRTPEAIAQLWRRWSRNGQARADSKPQSATLDRAWGSRRPTRTR